MKTVIVTKYGGPEVLALREAPIPDPSAGQILIRVKAAGINYADIMQRCGLYPAGPKPPFGAGFEVAGVVERVGAGVTQWRAGDAVAAFCENGYSEYVVAQAEQAMPKPPLFDFHQAAALPCQGLTAYHALFTLGRLAAGQTVLLQAAAGGLGTLMVQMARNVKATVIGACGSAAKCAALKELGCHYPINYREQDFEAEVQRITEGRGCDLVVESVGGEVFEKSLRCVKSRGMMITLGLASLQPVMVNPVELLSNNRILAGFHLFAYAGDPAAMAIAIRDIQVWIAEGKLTVLAEFSFPLERAAEAQQFVSDRRSIGKVVLMPGA